METRPRVERDAASRAFDIEHDDPNALARSAAVRSPRESDPLTRAGGRGLSMSERLEEGFRLARFASRLRRAAR